MGWLDKMLVKSGLVVDGFAPLPRSSDAWYGGYKLSSWLTQDEQKLLDLYTEEEWCDLIPYHIKVGVLKLTVKQTVVMFENYVLTGVWK